MAARKEKIEDLREACVQQALAIIETSGLENLSLREVSRRLGVSHQAPYKHFPSRDHILAEVVRRAFDSFAEYLSSKPRTDDAHADMVMMGQAYMDYAFQHPLQYRLMFGTPLPDAQEHPAMMQSAQHSFDLLRECIERVAQARDETPHNLTLDALFTWSVMHGLASIMQTQAINKLNLPADVLAHAIPYTLQHIGIALGFEPPQTDK